MTSVKKLIKEFKKRADENGIPCFTNAEWRKFRDQHDKQDIKNALAEYIHQNKVEFPLKRYPESKFQKLFKRFYETSHNDWLSHPKPNSVAEKFDYKYKYSDKPLGVIGKSHYYNWISDFFQQKNRLSCGSLLCDSPIGIWNDIEKLKTMNWHFWRDGVLQESGVDPKTFRSSFRLGTYTATQFKPSVAKFLYEYHNAKNILDTSCGWGDRLAAFYGTPNTESYLGCDPNPDVYEVYKKQCVAYEKLLGGNPVITEEDDMFICVGKKKVIIYNLPAEDVPWDLYENTIDLYFTSPPYFATEKYGIGSGAEENQSWSRYNTFESWRDDFFFHVTKSVWKTIRKNGYMMINIIEPSGKKGRHNLCDSMVEFCETLDNCHYVGKFGMRMMGRPHTADVDGCYIEPVWTFMKGKKEYTRIKSGLEMFME